MHKQTACLGCLFDPSDGSETAARCRSLRGVHGILNRDPAKFIPLCSCRTLHLGTGRQIQFETHRRRASLQFRACREQHLGSFNR
ncbi:hypothetical protein BDV18DRAFT_144421 [Aspergillus unguis]